MTKPTKRPQIQVERKKKLPEYRSFRLSGRIKADSIKVLPQTKALWKETWLFLWKHKKKMLIFVAVYAALYAVLVKGLNGFSLDTSTLKDEFLSVFEGNIGAAFTFITLYGSLISSLTSTTGDVTNYFQFSLIIISSLAFIWLVRKLHGRNVTVTVKEAFYTGMGPLVPFIIVLLIMALELIPAGLGAILLSTAQGSNVITTETEIMVLSIVMILTVVLSFYLLAGSIFALYIVTLPGTSPVVAVRSSMRLLRIHRWKVAGRILGFFALLILLGFVLVLPFIIWLPRFAEVAFFIMGSASFGVMHTYLYKLYRSLL